MTVAAAQQDNLFRFVGWFVQRDIWVPEWLFNWSLRREVERKGYQW